MLLKKQFKKWIKWLITNKNKIKISNRIKDKIMKNLIINNWNKFKKLINLIFLVVFKILCFTILFFIIQILLECMDLTNNIM